MFRLCMGVITAMMLYSLGFAFVFGVQDFASVNFSFLGKFFFVVGTIVFILTFWIPKEK